MIYPLAICPSRVASGPFVVTAEGDMIAASIKLKVHWVLTPLVRHSVGGIWQLF